MADDTDNGVESLLSPEAKSEATRLMRGLLGGAPKPPVDLVEDHQPVVAPDEQTPQPEAMGAKQQAAARAQFRYESDEALVNSPFGQKLLHLAVSNTDHTKITAADIDEIADDVERICRGAGVSADDIDDIIEVLKKNIGKPKETLASLKEAAKGMAEKAVTEAAAAKADESPEKRLDQSWAKIGELNKKIEDNFKKLEPALTDKEKEIRKKDEEAVVQATEELERLKKSGATQEEILAAEQRLHDAEKAKTEHDKIIADRIKNDPHSSPEHRTTAITTGGQLEEKLRELEKVQGAILEQQRLELKRKNPHLTEAQVEKIITTRREAFTANNTDLQNEAGKDEATAITTIENTLKNAQDQLKAMNAPAEQDSPALSIPASKNIPPAPAQLGDLDDIQDIKFEVASASQADEKAAPARSSGLAKSDNTPGKR